jgi:hypothetical protein
MVSARLFPVAKSFVEHVIDEGIEPTSDFPSGPYPGDLINRRSDTEVEFLTPANTDGLGTSGILSRNALAIHGVAILVEGENAPDVLMLRVRLSRSELDDLATTIVQTFDASVPNRPPLGGAWRIKERNYAYGTMIWNATMTASGSQLVMDATKSSIAGIAATECERKSHLRASFSLVAAAQTVTYHEVNCYGTESTGSVDVKSFSIDRTAFSGTFILNGEAVGDFEAHKL